MKLLTSTVLATALAFTAVSLSAAERGFESLFNGKNLKGWEGNPKLWSVRDGTITGETSKEDPIKVNTFLIHTNALPDDFELHFKYRIVAGNSGVQYRSKVTDPKQWRVGGYQADFEAGKTYSGILYDEMGVAGGRGIMAERGQKGTWGAEGKKQVTGSTGKTSEELQGAIKNEDWNSYVVTAKGYHFVHQINGNTTVDVTDEDEKKRLTSGVMALQLHVGAPMTVQFKDFEIKKLK